MGYGFLLDEHERKELLRIARATLKQHLLSGRMPPGAPHRASLLALAGVFVSLHEGHDLRGCIGNTAESAPLYKAVQEMAVAAATRDPRFPPLKMDELPRINLEISVLGERGVVKSPEDVEVGQHGLIVIGPGGRPKGLLLPQVAAEHAWTASEFLDRTCEKAGLPPGTWKAPGAAVERFTAQVFDERSLKVGPFAPA